MSDGDESDLGTDATNPDSDGDGSLDGEEVADGTDPNDPTSGGAETITPTNGFWEFSNVSIANDGCNIGFILGLVGGIESILPEGFDVATGGPSSFDGSIQGRGDVAYPQHQLRSSDQSEPR